MRKDAPDEVDAVCVPLAQLWSRKGDEFDACVGKDKLREVRDEFSDRLRTYGIPKVTLIEAELFIATEVFSRINTLGTELNTFEIMVAKTYDPDKGFDLVDKFEEFSAELQGTGFESIDATSILQLIALMLRDDCKKKTILSLERVEFIEAWPSAIINLGAAVDYIKSAFQIPVSRLLPYPSLVIPIALFFHQNKGKASQSGSSRFTGRFFLASGVVRALLSFV